MNRKIILTVLIMALSVTVSACEKITDDKNELVMPDSIVKQSVNNWHVYTNPAFRYELRFPADWRVVDSGEDGVNAWFYSPDKDNRPALTVNSYSNWKENYTIQDFYSRQPQDFFKAGYEFKEFKLNDKNAYWFKKVKLEDGEANVEVIDLDDRIVEVIIWDKWEQSRVVLNSLKFYPNKVIGGLK